MVISNSEPDSIGQDKYILKTLGILLTVEQNILHAISGTGIDTALMGIGHEKVEPVDTPPISMGTNECQQGGGAHLWFV